MIVKLRGIAVKTKEEIAKVLREFRQRTGLSAKEITDQLGLQDIKISPKTLYGWESGHSQPNADTLLLLCDIYGFEDIMKAFGYGNAQERQTETKTPEKDELHKEVDQLDENRCKHVSAFIKGLLAEQNNHSRGR
jgi:transcriptional regulator with XRE-family HTH domain